MSNDALQKLLEFEKMEKGHKESFFDIKKEFATKKIELLKKQCGEKTDLRIAGIQDVQKNGYTPELVKKCLDKKIALHEKNIQEWSALCEQKREKMKSWVEKNKIEREAFKKGL
jgi:hypothetical protein